MLEVVDIPPYERQHVHPEESTDLSHPHLIPATKELQYRMYELWNLPNVRDALNRGTLHTPSSQCAQQWPQIQPAHV
ncbi:hypothetical protein FRC04_011901 [Tulasnella sp. 424]|nr:hypothetical protein FRC04_011901 [Tulasnella sp. 424]